ILHDSAPLTRRCSQLLALARARGSIDDATVLVVRPEPRRARLAWLLISGVLIAAFVASLAIFTVLR
ncbi:MAG TPA: hypothetical protein VFR50_03825, partial [Casimicrobiaceae bacterium]|nr:hypothetical protein [Casimicrobiaceae bacterium]